MSSKEFWDARYRDRPESWGDDPNIFLSEIELPGLSTAVDLAGGNGRNSLWLASKGLTVENVDISPVALEQFLERAKQRGIESNCQINASDAQTAEFGLTPDLLVIAYLQIDSDGFFKALRNAFAQLRDGSQVLGVWHAVENLEHGYGGPPDKSVLVSKSHLEQIASEYSWDELNIENRDRVVKTDNGDQIAKDVVMFGKLRV